MHEGTLATSNSSESRPTPRIAALPRSACPTLGPIADLGGRPLSEARKGRRNAQVSGEDAMTEAPKFDPEKSWAPLEIRIAREKDPRRRQNLEQVRDHMRTEIRGEIDGLMATLADEPSYHFWGAPVEGGPKGHAAVDDFYRQMIAGGGNHFHFDIKRIVVDEETVVTEGQIHQEVAGAALLASGIQEVEGVPVDGDSMYLSETHIVTVWPMTSDGRIIGEDIYFGSPPLERLRHA